MTRVQERGAGRIETIGGRNRTLSVTIDPNIGGAYGESVEHVRTYAPWHMLWFRRCDRPVYAGPSQPPTTSSSMELSFTLRSPAQRDPLHSAEIRDALVRAQEASRDPLGTLPMEPWQFYHLNAEAVSSVAWLYARLLEDEVGADGARSAYEQWRAIPGWI